MSPFFVESAIVCCNDCAQKENQIKQTTCVDNVLVYIDLNLEKTKTLLSCLFVSSYFFSFFELEDLKTEIKRKWLERISGF